jgi:hypothetical protein
MDLKERFSSAGISCEQPFYDRIKHEVSRTDSRSAAIVFDPDLVTTKEGSVLIWIVLVAFTLGSAQVVSKSFTRWVINSGKIPVLMGASRIDPVNRASYEQLNFGIHNIVIGFLTNPEVGFPIIDFRFVTGREEAEVKIAHLMANAPFTPHVLLADESKRDERNCVEMPCRGLATVHKGYAYRERASSLESHSYSSNSEMWALTSMERLLSKFHAILSRFNGTFVLDKTPSHGLKLPLHNGPLPSVDIGLNSNSNKHQETQCVYGKELDALSQVREVNADEEQNQKENRASENNPPQPSVRGVVVIIIGVVGISIGLVILWHGLNLYWPKDGGNTKTCVLIWFGLLIFFAAAIAEFVVVRAVRVAYGERLRATSELVIVKTPSPYPKLDIPVYDPLELASGPFGRIHTNLRGLLRPQINYASLRPQLRFPESLLQRSSESEDMGLEYAIECGCASLVCNGRPNLHLFVGFKGNNIKDHLKFGQRPNQRNSCAFLCSRGRFSGGISLTHGSIGLSDRGVSSFSGFSEAAFQRVGLLLHAIGLILHRAELPTHGVDLFTGRVSLPLSSFSQPVSILAAFMDLVQLPSGEPSIENGRKSDDAGANNSQLRDWPRASPATAKGLLVIGTTGMAYGCHLLVIGLCFNDRKRQRLTRGAALLAVGLALFHFSLFSLLK